MRKSSIALPLSLSALYLLLVVPISARLQLWHDDVFVLAIARLGGWSSIWQGLKQGSDNLPPLDYWLHHLSMSSFGESPFAFHLPSVLAIWGAMLLVYATVNRSLGSLYGAAAALLMLVTVGYDASVQTRGHALLLLCFALGLWSWDRLSQSWSIFAEVVLAAALTAAAYSHYYGVLLALSLFAAACATQVREGRLDVRAFVPFVVAGVCCLPLVSLGGIASSYRQGFWTPVTLTAVVDFFPTLLVRVINCAVGICVCLAFAPVAAGASTDTLAPKSFPRATTFALVAIVVQGIPMFLMAKLSTGAFHPEYAQSAAVALVMLALAQIAKTRLTGGLVGASLIGLPVCFLLFMAARSVQGFLNEPQSRDTVDRLVAFQAVQTEPVVMTDDALFVVLSYQREAAPLANCYFVYDTDPERRTNVDRALAGLTPLMHLKTAPYDQFRQQYRRFTVVGDPGSPVIAKALSDGASVTLNLGTPGNVKHWSVRFN